MDNRSGFGEEDDSNTGEVGERELGTCAGVQCTVRRKVQHDAWMNDLLWHTIRVELKPLEPCTHVICAV